MVGFRPTRARMGAFEWILVATFVIFVCLGIVYIINIQGS